MDTRARPGVAAAVLATALPMFMAGLDNLIVTNALPVIRDDLGLSLPTLQWVVNAYALAFATLLLTAAALGDRIGRRRMFLIGIVVFTLGSAACALSVNASMLIIARAVQGAGAAAILPLSLTLLAAAVSPERRALAIGIWGGIQGLGIAVGPLVGGAVIGGLGWEWVFWLNVPIGALAVPLALRVLDESRGPDRALDPLGLVLSGLGVLSIIWGVINAGEGGMALPAGIALLGGMLLIALFAQWQRRAPHPMLPVRLFHAPGFVAANLAAIAFSFGMFGSVFLLSQFFQVVQSLSPFAAGVVTMPWTLAPMVVAPLAGLFAARIGTRTLIITGMVLLTVALGWMASVIAVDVSFAALVAPFLLAGIGFGLTTAPISTAVLASVPEADHGKASGTNSTLRQLGLALGVAVLTAVFTANGSYTSGRDYVSGLVPALWWGAAAVAVGALVALALPRRSATAQPVPSGPTRTTATRKGSR